MAWEIHVKTRESRKRKQSEDSDDEECMWSARKKQPSGKEEEVCGNPEGKHASNFTQMQYRIWAKMITGGLHASTDDPPNTSMFTRASNNSTPTGRMFSHLLCSYWLRQQQLSHQPCLPSLLSVGVGHQPVQWSFLKVDLSFTSNYLSSRAWEPLESWPKVHEYCTEKSTTMELLRKLKADAWT